MRDNRGVVALWIAIVIPVCLLTLAICFNVGRWTVMQTRSQNAADIAARTGIMTYKLALGFNRDQLAHNQPVTSEPDMESAAMTEAVKLAKLNGASLTTGAFIPGIVSGSDKALTVTITQAVPLLWFTSVAPHRVTATATAELTGDAPATGEDDTRQPALVQ